MRVDRGCLEREGFFLERSLVDESQIEALRGEVERLQCDADKVCVRDVLQRSELVARMAEDLIPFKGAIAVRGIVFDKTPEENWPVPWHQDLSIAVAERVEVSGYSAWTVKEGVMHVQPPVELLEQMVTLRIHLDDTPAENGALRVVGGSHGLGRLDSTRIAEVAAKGESICEAEVGDGLWMSPLILHSSSRSEGSAHRRVIHLEFAPEEALSPLLCWNE